MPSIDGFRVKNFRALGDITLGRLWNRQKEAALSPMTVVIGKNGVGKSSLFDAFGFLSDCLKFGVEEACDMHGRGGFSQIRTKGEKGPVEFEIYYKENKNSRPITYELKISERRGRPYVYQERLRQRRKGQTYGWPFSFLFLNSGRGLVWKGKSDGYQIDETKRNLDISDLEKTIRAESAEANQTEEVKLDDIRRLGIATLGTLTQHPRISAFRRFIEGWYLSYFTPDAARSMPMAGPQKHLNLHGDNIGNVVQFMEREHRERFQKILKRIAEKIPGITDIKTERTNDNRLLLQFYQEGIKSPLYAHQMSDGTLKIFAYLLLLEDPASPPFMCIEEPENGLYHKLLEPLANELRQRAENGTQIFITTHQPYFVDALSPKEVWILERGKDKKGLSVIHRASENELINNLTEEGLPLGGLWYSDYLDGR